MIGEKYYHEASLFEGDFQNHHWHDECISCFREDISEMEFDPYCNDRPKKSDQSNKNLLLD